MVWRNYYSPKQNDPYSLAALERQSKTVLEQRRKYYENIIKNIEKKFNHNNYKKRITEIPYKLLIAKGQEIEKKFQKILKKKITIKIKYYALLSFFGSYKRVS